MHEVAIQRLEPQPQYEAEATSIQTHETRDCAGRDVKQARRLREPIQRVARGVSRSESPT